MEKFRINLESNFCISQNMPLNSIHHKQLFVVNEKHVNIANINNKWCHLSHSLVINLSSSIRLHKEGNNNLRAPKKEVSNFVFKCLDPIFYVETMLALCLSAQCKHHRVVLAVVICILSKYLLSLYNGQGKSQEYLFGARD